MFKNIQKLSERKANRREKNRLAKTKRRSLRLESLEDRQLFAINALLTSGGVLQVTGSDAADRIQVINHGLSTVVYDNGTAVFGAPTLAVTKISIDARGGDDTAQVVNLPHYHPDPVVSAYYTRVIPATIDGGAGNDVLTGSQANDLLRDTSGNNTMQGKDGNDVVYGGSGNDVIDGGNGDDQLYGYGGRNTIQGGRGADKLFGGADADVLEGGDGNDMLYAYGGDDVLRGDEGNDILYADGGNDVLWGGGGSDQLYGYGGNDRLYGDGGNDTLDGGSGNDGLFGGAGHDTLRGGTGADRFLVWDAIFTDIAYHTVQDRESVDATIRFRDTWTNQSANGMNWTGDIWTENEIEQVDDSLNWFHELTNNTNLLKTNRGTDMVFERWGDNLESAGGGIFAWNLGNGRMAITDHGFENGKAELDLSVIHEIAHNWDSENPLWSQWLTLSGWRQRSDGSWFSNSSAVFYGGGAANPFEDFAWCFEAYYRRDIGTLPGTTATQLSAKLNLIDQFVQSMVS